MLLDNEVYAVESFKKRFDANGFGFMKHANMLSGALSNASTKCLPVVFTTINRHVKKGNFLYYMW